MTEAILLLFAGLLFIGTGAYVTLATKTQRAIGDLRILNSVQREYLDFLSHEVNRMASDKSFCFGRRFVESRKG